MRVTLLHNPHAGAGEPGPEALRKLIEASGHRVVSVMTFPSEAGQPDVRGADVLVVAGGDGTVRRAAVAAAEHDVPIAVLPLGTANNLAASLGIGGPLEALAASWDESRFRNVDLGVAETRRGTFDFLEGAGAGALAGIVLAKASGPRDLDSPARLTRAWTRFQEELHTHPPVSARIEVDGVELAGDFVLLEVLNTPRIGPGIELVPDADPGDGRLDLALIAAGDVPGRTVVDPVEIPGLVETRRGREIRMEVSATYLHVDGLAHPTPGETWRASVGERRVRVLGAARGSKRG